MARQLIVNADDLGYDPAIDRGILEAARAGVVTSTTLMANLEGAREAARLARTIAGLGVGLHVNLARGPSLSSAVDFSALDHASAAALEREIEAQFSRFHELAHCAPTHLDFHRHTHRLPAVLEAAIAVARRHALPVRSLDEAMRAALRHAGVATTDAFTGDTGAAAWWTREKLLAAFDAAAVGTTELMCHPGYAPERISTSYGAQRADELAALLDPAVVARAQAGDPSLVSWSALSR